MGEDKYYTKNCLDEKDIIAIMSAIISTQKHPYDSTKDARRELIKECVKQAKDLFDEAKNIK